MQNNDIGKIIKDLRIKNKLSQQDLAKKLNTNHSTISKWENNIITPDLYSIEKLANIFDTSIDNLLNNKYQKKKKTLSIVIIILLSLIILLLSFIIASRDNIQRYTISGNENNISLKGSLVKSKKFSFLIIDNIEYIDLNTGTDTSIRPKNLSITVKNEDIILLNQIIENTDNKALEDLLREESINIEIDKPQIDNLKLIISYQTDQDIKKIEIPIKTKNK